MKFSKLTIVILSLSLITLVGYLGYQVYTQTSKSGFATVDPKYTTPLNPNLDQNLLRNLQDRASSQEPLTTPTPLVTTNPINSFSNSTPTPTISNLNR